MTPETRKKIQLVLLALLVITTIRAGIIFYNRHEDRIAAEQQKRKRDLGYSDADLYVSPKKLHPYDIKSAKQLTQQPAWVREGYHYAYFPYDPPTKHVDFGRDAGLLGPLEKLKITDVIKATPSGAGERPQVLALFEKDGKSFAVSIGYESNDGYTIYSDDMFFVEDPHELYRHWPADVWQAVDQHQVKPGMNELQTDFAIGMGMPESGGTSYEKMVHYPNGDKPLVVVFHDGKVTEVHPDTSTS